MTTLKNCPFCGGKAVKQMSASNPFVYCEGCDANGPECDTIGGAVEFWNTRPSASREIAVKPLDFVWTKDEYADNPTTYRTFGDGYSAYVLIPYEGDNDPEAGIGTWNGVAQHRGQTEFASKEAAIEYCEQTIRDFAQVKVNAASNFIALTPTPGNTDPIAKDDELRKVQGGWRDMDDPALEQIKRDGTDVLVYSIEGIELAWWSDGQSAWMTRDGTYVPEEPTHWMPLPPAPTEHPTEQPSVRDAARLTPDQLLEQIADRLENSDPDVAPWAVKWADGISTAISNSDPNPKSIAAALRSLAQEGE